MNLLDMLSGSLTADSSVDALAGKTGASSDQTSSLINAALPILMGALTNNASSQDGAQSLLGALSQHTDMGSMAQQLMTADEEDGEKIIQHILGGNSQSVIQSLSGQTGMDSSQVSSLLNNMAPAMMSGLSAATTQASNAPAGEALDFSSLMGAFGGSQGGGASGLLGGLLGGGDSSGGGLGNLLGGLFGGGGGNEDTSAFDGSSLLSSLMNFMN